MTVTPYDSTYNIQRAHINDSIISVNMLKSLLLFPINILLQYGYCMLQKLPYKGFRWGAITLDQIKNFNSNGNMACFVEVDATIPVEFHDYLNDMPPFPESCVISEEMTSATTRKLRSNRFGDKYTAKPTKKLAPNFYRKQGYVCHVGALQKWIELGGQIEKIGRVLWFEQKAWLAPYIRFNTEKRMAATSEFKKSFYKLMVRHNADRYFY